MCQCLNVESGNGSVFNRHDPELLVVFSMLSEGQEVRVVVRRGFFHIQHESQSAPDGEIIVEVPLLVVSSVLAPHYDLPVLRTSLHIKNKPGTEQIVL